MSTQREADVPLSARLREIRREYKLTQDDLAARLGVKGITVSRWERGVQRVLNRHLLEVALERLETDLAEERRLRGAGRPARRRARRGLRPRSQ